MINQVSYHVAAASKHVYDCENFKYSNQSRNKMSKYQTKIRSEIVILVTLMSSMLLKSASAESNIVHSMMQRGFEGTTQNMNEKKNGIRRRATNNATIEIQCPTYPEPKPLPGKKGIGRALNAEGTPGDWTVNLPGVLNLDVYWNYDWSEERIDAQPDDIEFMPMTWGSKDYNFTKNEIEQDVRPQVEKGLALRFLGYNEPDHQSLMTVETAIEHWPIFETLGVPLVSPSCAFPDKEWMEYFMSNASALCLRVDYIGVHWYGSANFIAFRAFMMKMYEKYQLPILITEFAPADWSAQTIEDHNFPPSKILSFMKVALPWLESTDWISGYAWFSFKPDSKVGWSSSLFHSNNELTAIGRYYKSVRSDNIYGDLSIEVDDF